MSNSTEGNSPHPPKAGLNQNLIIAIIGAVATLLAAIIPWMLDRASQDATPTPIVVQATFTAEAQEESTATQTQVAASPTPEPPTETATPAEEMGIYNTYLAFDFEGKFIETNFNNGQPIYLFFELNDPTNKNIVRVVVSAVDVPGVLVDTQYYNTINEYTDPSIRLIVSQGALAAGKYKVDILLNNTLDESIEFNVTE